MAFAFELAQPSDEAELRHMAAEIPVPGVVEVSYRREPDYFAGCRTHGPFVQVIAARDDQRRLVGMGCRSVSSLWLNGEERQVGYLSGLRVHPERQGGGILFRAFDFLRELGRDQRAEFTLTTIIEGNEPALSVLVKQPSPSLPTYQKLFGLVTRALPLIRRRPPQTRDGVSIEIGTVESVLQCLQRYGSQYQLFPSLRSSDLGVHAPAAENFLVARKGGHVLGCLGLWEQPAKQTVVERYHGVLGWTRGVISKLTDVKLPDPGQELRMAYAALGCGEPETFAPLLEAVYHEARRRGLSYLMVGLCEEDPRRETVAKFHHWTYPSGVYLVKFEQEEVTLDGRCPYLEIATL